MGGRLSALGGHCRRALKLLEECNETFRHGLFQGRILDLEESSDCQQPRSSGQDVRTSGWVSHWPFPSRITRAARPKPTTDWLMLAILNCQSEDVKSSRRSKREGGKDEPHLLSSRSAPITRDHMSGSWNCHRFWCSARFCRVIQACTRFWMAQLVFKSKENPAIHNGTWCNDPHTVDWLAFEGPAHRLPAWLFCLIILSAGKELFPPHRCRRSAGSGFHCRPDGPRRKERIWDL
jgi:hypothetical protein